MPAKLKVGLNVERPRPEESVGLAQRLGPTGIYHQLLADRAESGLVPSRRLFWFWAEWAKSMAEPPNGSLYQKFCRRL